MLVSADFTTIPERYAKQAPDDSRVDGVPCVSFPFYIDHLSPSAKYLHWEFSDPDSIPVCGFEWIHWTMANLPVDAIMFDPSDAHALQIPADFSRNVNTMIPEAAQGRNSQASPLYGQDQQNLQLVAHYTGPQPPDKDHEYMLQVWARPIRSRTSSRASGSTTCCTALMTRMSSTSAASRSPASAERAIYSHGIIRRDCGHGCRVTR